MHHMCYILFRIFFQKYQCCIIYTTNKTFLSTLRSQSLVTNSTQAHQLKELSSAICASDSARKKKISLEKKEKEEKKGKKD